MYFPLFVLRFLIRCCDDLAAGAMKADQACVPIGVSAGFSLASAIPRLRVATFSFPFSFRVMAGFFWLSLCPRHSPVMALLSRIVR